MVFTGAEGAGSAAACLCAGAAVCALEAGARIASAARMATAQGAREAVLDVVRRTKGRLILELNFASWASVMSLDRSNIVTRKVGDEAPGRAAMCGDVPLAKVPVLGCAGWRVGSPGGERRRIFHRGTGINR